MRVRSLIAVGLLALSLSAVLWGAEASVPGDPLVDPGFRHFYNNEYDAALQAFRAQVQAHPGDATLYNSISQTILYREMYRDGALETQLVTGSNSFLRRPRMQVAPSDSQEFNGAIDQAIELSQEKLKQDPRDVYALYALAVAHGLRANYLFMVEKSWLQSLRETTAARKADDRVLELAPDFVDARLIRGLSEYVVSCLPGYLRMLGSLNGFHGNREDGIRQLELVVNSGVRNRYDAAVLLAAIYRREKRPGDAIPLLVNLANTFPRNYLFRFEQVQMYGDLGEKNSALRVLAQLEAASTQGQPGYANLPLERVDYARGNLLFWYNDLGSSLASLRKATGRPHELDPPTAAMAWLRLGQVSDLLGDRRQAENGYKMAISTAPDSEIAKEASNYIEKAYQRKRF